MDPYIGFCQELQYLTFLVKFAKHHNYPVKAFLCSVMKSKYNATETDVNGQISLFSKSNDLKKPLSYGRLVLSLTDLPKKNPHHYLIQNILNHTSSLSPQGYLYVLTNQQIFVPSRSQKVAQLLNKGLKIVAFFNFGELIGKGEVPHYIYVLKKRKTLPASKTSPIIPCDLSKQDSCLSFRFTGKLSIFKKFETLVSELDAFFQKKHPHSTPLYGKQLENQLNFEFHRDAIIDGKLLSSISKDQHNITHPSFFKSLTKNCTPLENFFTIENINHEDNQDNKFTSHFLGIDFKKNNVFSHVLIVDHRNPNFASLEIVTFEAYKGKRERYGIAFYQYFGLTPKIPNLNINLLREFFSTDLGTQIIQFSLSGGHTKIKSKLNALLIPEFFAHHDDFDARLRPRLEIFKLSPDHILSSHPDSLKEQIDQGLEILREHALISPWMGLSLINHFKFNLMQVIEKIGSGSYGTNYNNPLILRPLLALQTHPVYPNEDIYLDFGELKSKEELQAPPKTDRTQGKRGKPLPGPVRR